MNYVFDNAGFKKFLLTNGVRFRADGLSIWVNKIPVPLDLFDEFFDSWRDYFELYIDHVMVSTILADSPLEVSAAGINFKDLPRKTYSVENSKNLNEIIRDKINRDNDYQVVAMEIASVLGINDYTLDSGSLMDALHHNGKKYERMFYPGFVRQIIGDNFPIVLTKVATSNGDMFGNIIADGIGLYRGGFGDALSALFNKLLEYKIVRCAGFIGGENSVKLRFEDSTSKSIDERVVTDRTSNGCLWEPFFDGDLKIKLNSNHPFYKVIADSGNPQAIFEFLLKMSEIESNSRTSRELELLEDLRMSLSRALWRN